MKRKPGRPKTIKPNKTKVMALDAFWDIKTQVDQATSAILRRLLAEGATIETLRIVADGLDNIEETIDMHLEIIVQEN